MSLYVLILALGLALVWALWCLRRDAKVAAGLARSLRKGQGFLRDLDQGSHGNQGWKQLIEAANGVLEEKKNLETDRAGQVERLEVTLANMQEAVLIVDDEDRVLLANDAFRRLFSRGEGREESIRRVLRNGALNEHLSAVRRGETAGRREVHFLSDGSSIWAEVSGSRIAGFGNEATDAILLLLHDITRLKSLESVRKEFVANVSHELRTPLSLIKGYVETLADPASEVPEDDRRRFLRIIEKHTDRLERLVEDLLALSRLESGNPRLQKEKIMVESLMEEIVESLQTGEDAAGYDFSLKPDANAVPVEADPLRINQVLGNLLQNAIKYSGGKGKIEAGTRREGGYIKAWVHDSGVGIAEKDLPHIFERFYRVDKGRSRESGGTGLGLSIVKHIVQLHGGRVWAESSPGQGTCIYFTLPIAGHETASSGK